MTAATTRPMKLGGTTFNVPLLPLRHNRIVYPLCRDLSTVADGDDDAFFARLMAKQGTPDAVRDDEWDKLIEIAFHAAQAADSALDRAAFDDMAITPPQLIDAFFTARFQTGAWLAPEETAPAKDAEQGEAPGV